MLTLEFGDITASKADVLVSSDDSYLTMGGQPLFDGQPGKGSCWKLRRKYRPSWVMSS
jgi:hypothetical protein